MTDHVELTPWRWACPRCGLQLWRRPQHQSEDTWPLLRVQAVRHLREEHFIFGADVVFDASEWTQGGAPCDFDHPEASPEIVPWDLEEAAKLANLGMVYREIGERYGMSASGVEWRLMKAGLKPPRRKARSGRVHEKLTTQQRRAARRLLRQGKSMAAVARELGISKRTVRLEAGRIGWRFQAGNPFS